MKPILYNGNETDFTGNGIAVLAEALSCEVREVRNGEFELTLEYPVDGPWFKEIIEQRIVRAKPNDKDDLHNFRIYNVNKASSGESVVAQAATLSNDLGGNLVKYLRVDKGTAQSALNAMKLNLVEATKYNFVSDISTLASTIWEMRNPLNCILGEEGSLVDIWGGEVKRTDTTIYLYSRRGLDKVTRIRPRKGMTGFSMKTSVASVVTRVQPYAVYRDEKTEQEVTVIGTIVESPRKGNYAFSRILPVQYTENADGTPIKTTAQLNALAKNYFTENPNIDKPKVEINADLIALADTTFYDKFKKLETIGLTDTIEVYVPKYDIDVELKITELVYNVLTEQVISLKAGDTSSTFYQSNKYEYGYEVNQLKKYIYTVENGLRNYVQISADGKNTIFRGYTEPDKSISHEGDLWFKEVGNGEQEIWIFDGSYWQPIVTAGINEELAAKLAEVQEAIDAAEKSLSDAQAELANVSQATTAAQAAANQALAAGNDAKAKVEQAQQDIILANETIGKHATDLSTLFSDFATIDSAVDTIVIDTGTMKTAISENAADILTAQQLAQSAKSKADDVEATTHTITQDLTTVTETITTIEETATSTTKTLNEVKSTVDGQVQTIATVKSTADSALSKSNINSTTIDGIQSTLTSTKTTADSALTKATQVEATVDGVKTTVASVKTTSDSALTKATQVETTANGLKTTISSVETTASNALTKATQVETTADSLVFTVNRIDGGGPNLIANGGFENDYVGWTQPAGFSITTSESHSGFKSLAISNNGSMGRAIGRRLTVPVIPGRKYEVSYWYKTTADANGTSGNQQLRIANAAGSLINALGWDGASTEWTQISQIYTVGSNTFEWAITLTASHTVGTVWWDDVSVVDVTDREMTASQITQLSDQIDLRVTKNGVINSINLSTEGIAISGNRLSITAETYMATAIIKTAHIADLNVTTAKIANLAVSNAKIGDLAVTNAKIADLAVTAAKIANATITNAEIAKATILAANIANATITDAQIGSLNASKITAGILNAANVNIINLNVAKLVGDKTNFVQSAWNNISSSVTIDAYGMNVSRGDGSISTKFIGDGIQIWGGGAWQGSLSYATGPNIALWAKKTADLTLGYQGGNTVDNVYYTALKISGDTGRIDIYNDLYVNNKALMGVLYITGGDTYFTGAYRIRVDATGRIENNFYRRANGTRTIELVDVAFSSTVHGVGWAHSNGKSGIMFASDGGVLVKRNGGTWTKI